MTTQKVYLVRHGETAWSLSGQHTGTTDIPLTGKGETMAKAFKPLFANEIFSLVLTSPLTRARKTCELAGLASEAIIEPGLMEWDYGAYEGLTSKEIKHKDPDWLLFKNGCPNGETPSQVQKRVDQVIAKIHEAKGDVALFAHGHILRVLAARWLALPVTAGSHFLLDTATLSILSTYQGFPAVKQWNAAVV